MLLAGLGSVRIGKNCDLGLENAALGLRPREAFSRPRSQFFPIRTSQPANNIYLLTEWEGQTGNYMARGPYVLTVSQIFSRPARPYSVNKYFII